MDLIYDCDEELLIMIHPCLCERWRKGGILIHALEKGQLTLMLGKIEGKRRRGQ